jgi:hypothetical protein
MTDDTDDEIEEERPDDQDDVDEPDQEDVDRAPDEFDGSKTATIDADMAAAIEESTAPEDDDQEAGDDADDAETALEEPEELDDFGFGRMYVNGLATGSAVLISRAEGEEFEADDAEDYKELAESMEIDRYADLWADEHLGAVDPSSPGMALVATSAMFVATVGLEHPEASAELLEGRLNGGEEGEDDG